MTLTPEQKEALSVVESTGSWQELMNHVEFLMEQAVADAQMKIGKLEFQVAELDFGAGGVLASLRERNERIERLIKEREQVVAVMVDTLRLAGVALDDWLNTYALDFCDEKRVAEAQQRIAEKGTIGYIADIQALIRKTLSPVPEEEEFLRPEPKE